MRIDPNDRLRIDPFDTTNIIVLSRSLQLQHCTVNSRDSAHLKIDYKHERCPHYRYGESNSMIGLLL